MAADQYENDDHRIQEKFKQKTWNEMTTSVDTIITSKANPIVHQADAAQ
jgi:hypothetical protein